jgi:hypothetical protein
VPSSPKGPWSSGSTTTGAAPVVASVGSGWTSGPAADRARGSEPGPASSASTAAVAWTQRPSSVMPTGTTS